ncbi:hypothetical protein E2C01_064064 [Portunus trituberculatus]|uniref:Uncharacterized protein n=1 Tax=Portunus trituberculatus TaxID=210409 RepID=A0A5B7HMR4_PORTR|nr:hypothetical protein [Portunus trituberculatus]
MSLSNSQQDVPMSGRDTSHFVDVVGGKTPSPPWSHKIHCSPPLPKQLQHLEIRSVALRHVMPSGDRGSLTSRLFNLT